MRLYRSTLDSMYPTPVFREIIVRGADYLLLKLSVCLTFSTTVRSVAHFLGNISYSETLSLGRFNAHMSSGPADLLTVNFHFFLCERSPGKQKRTNFQGTSVVQKVVMTVYRPAH